MVILTDEARLMVKISGYVCHGYHSNCIRVLAIGIGINFLWKRRKEGKISGTNYRTLFILGITFNLLGIVSGIIFFTSHIQVFLILGLTFIAMGLLYLIIGLIIEINGIYKKVTATGVEPVTRAYEFQSRDLI